MPTLTNSETNHLGNPEKDIYSFDAVKCYNANIVAGSEGGRVEARVRKGREDRQRKGQRVLQDWAHHFAGVYICGREEAKQSKGQEAILQDQSSSMQENLSSGCCYQEQKAINLPFPI